MTTEEEIDLNIVAAQRWLDQGTEKTCAKAIIASNIALVLVVREQNRQIRRIADLLQKGVPIEIVSGGK